LRTSGRSSRPSIWPSAAARGAPQNLPHRAPPNFRILPSLPRRPLPVAAGESGAPGGAGEEDEEGRRRRRRSIQSKAAKSGFYLHRTRRRQGHRCSRCRRGNRPSTRRSVGRGSYIALCTALCTLLFSFAVLGVTWVVLHVCSIFFHFGSERSDRQAIAIEMSLVIILISKL